MKDFKYVILFSISLCIACQSSTKKTGKEKIDKKEIQKEIDEIMYPLPSPFELTNMLNDIEASYIIGITNEADKASTYLTMQNQALNLGIYSSDLAYASTYNLSGEINLYLTSVKALAKELGIIGAVDKNLALKIEESIENKDKITEVITDLFYKTYSYLNKNGNTELSYLILAGTWIEGIYLTTNISENTFDNINIIKIIMKQEESLKKILELMESYKHNDMLKPVYANLKEIMDVYKIEEGTDALSISQLQEITKLVSNYRSEIIN